MGIKREDFPLMPDEQLKGIYKSRLKLRKLITAPVLFISFALTLVYFAAGFFQQTIFNPHFSNPILPVLIPIAFFVITVVSALFIISDNTRSHLIMGLAGFACQAVILVLQSLLDIKIQSVQLILLVFSAFAHLTVIPLIKDLEALRACPSFPFENWRRDVTYSCAVSGERGLRYTENVTRGGVRSSGHEDIFDKSFSDLKKTEDDDDGMLQSHPVGLGRTMSGGFDPIFDKKPSKLRRPSDDDDDDGMLQSHPINYNTRNRF